MEEGAAEIEGADDIVGDWEGADDIDGDCEGYG